MESLTGFLTDLTGFLTLSWTGQHCPGRSALSWTVSTVLDGQHCPGRSALSWTVSTVLDGQYRVQGTGYRVQGGEFEGRKKRGERGKKLLDNCWIIAGLLLNNCLLTPA